MHCIARARIAIINIGDWIAINMDLSLSAAHAKVVVYYSASLLYSKALVDYFCYNKCYECLRNNEQLLWFFMMAIMSWIQRS
jgi:hypothetical protein